MAILALADTNAAISLQPGTYTNEEYVYFERDGGREPPPWIGVEIGRDGSVRRIDPFGGPVASAVSVKPNADTPHAVTIETGGKTHILRRARGATCWAALRKDKPKPDGGEDWHFERNLKLHDQGGRRALGGADTGVPAIVLRMRNVVWPAGNTNRPSLVLYIHSIEQPDRALAYAWADPGAARIGLNLRWVQASCTIEGREDS
ncbi:hypothetical protein D3876_10170 [Sphingomonas cavernae]|uniref:Uncharacterized protein n=1 Tax=Sphingomonas cavernae TaxID=2320861 RepID=A0A418WKW8_9SPHN|nr:hypothetical protein D3876_10170 [Sphingomonas cavernae]